MGNASTALATVLSLLLVGCATDSHKLRLFNRSVAPLPNDRPIDPSPNTASPPTVTASGISARAADAWAAADLSEHLFSPSRRFSDSVILARPRSRLRATLCDTTHKLLDDYKGYYSWPNARNILHGVAANSVLANTSMDQDFRDWYQEDIQTSDIDRFASFWESFGEGQIFIPSFAVLGVVATMCGDGPMAGTVRDFSFRTERAYAVGVPALLFLQSGLGASRPGESYHASHWRPFQDDNGVSGHAFIGAVPFLTAAEMTESPLIKGGLYFCSTLPGWSRVNDDKHYLSQACLGWWLAYLACRTVNHTDFEKRQLALVPITTSEMTGMGIIYRK